MTTKPTANTQATHKKRLNERSFEAKTRAREAANAANIENARVAQQTNKTGGKDNVVNILA